MTLQKYLLPEAEECPASETYTGTEKEIRRYFADVFRLTVDNACRSVPGRFCSARDARQSPVAVATCDTPPGLRQASPDAAAPIGDPHSKSSQRSNDVYDPLRRSRDTILQRHLFHKSESSITKSSNFISGANICNRCSRFLIVGCSL